MSAKRYYISSTGQSDDCDAFAVEKYDRVRASDHEWVKAEDHAVEIGRLREAANRLLDVAAAAVRDGEPLYPDAVPEFDGLARALAREGDEDE